MLDRELAILVSEEGLDRRWRAGSARKEDAYELTETGDLQMKRRDLLAILGASAGVSVSPDLAAEQACASPGVPLNYASVPAVCRGDTVWAVHQRAPRVLQPGIRPQF